MSNYLDKFSLQGKTAFIAGGAGLLGKEITKALADVGGKVVILDSNQEQGQALAKNLQKKHPSVEFEQFDVTDLKNIEQGIDTLKEKYGQIDIWVNTAYPKTKDWGNNITDLSVESWQKNIDMQLNSSCWISRKVCLIMSSQQSGSLINLGSIYGVVGTNFIIYEGTEMTCPMAYAAIKGGIVNMTRYLAAFFGKDNVRINTVCPGGIFDNQNKDFVDNYSRQTPLKRMGKPEEIAAAVLFLASDAASYITGATIMIDGGWTAV